jgi:hypothetical protein
LTVMARCSQGNSDFSQSGLGVRVGLMAWMLT